MYISFDDGKNWQAFQLNLPIVPITDLAIKNDNLIAATQGRSFWMIDDLTPLHQLDTDMTKEEVILFKPKDSYRMSGGRGATSKTQGTNHYGGVAINFFIKEQKEENPVSMSIYESNGKHIKTFSTKPNKEKKEGKLDLSNGNNIFYWDMMYSGAERVQGIILWWASLSGPMALPGDYKVTLKVGDVEKTQGFTILKNPISETTLADAKAQFDFINDINDKVTEIHKALKNIKKVRDQINTLKKSIKDQEKHKELLDFADMLAKDLTAVEEALYQTKSKSRQDPLNFPIRLNNKLAHLNSLTRIGTYRPTQQAIDFKNEISKEIDAELAKLYSLFNNEIKELNSKVKDSQIDFIQLD